ncbi:Smoothened-like [Exaiptasia diaphana]|nr:Smoothened-like [Exaiptasia diaphana]
MAGIIWFVVLAYAWCICFKTLGSTRDNFTGKTFYFHGISWSLPAVLTGCALMLKKVDANSISGICFVGYEDANMRALFLLGPLGLNLFIGGVFLAKGIFAFVAFAFGFITFACHLYEYSNLKMWEKSYRDYLYCIADTEVKGTVNKCKVNERPNLSVIELGLSSLFGAGVAMSSWKWTSNTFRTWKKLWHRITKAQRYPELSHYRLIRRMRKNRVGCSVTGTIFLHLLRTHLPPGQAAVLFNHEPRLTAIKSAEENWRRRKSKLTAAPSIQLESVYSEQQSEQFEPAGCNKETTSLAATKSNTSEQKPRTLDSSSLYDITST